MKEAGASSHENVFSLRIKPDWDEIPQARNECRHYLESVDCPRDRLEVICMVTSELLENAVKYGGLRRKTDGIDLQIKAEPENVLLEVKGALGFTYRPLSPEGNPDLKKLDHMIQWIRSFQSPFQAYIERLQEVARQPLESDESGLGLVRIAYEGQALLDFFVDENDVLSISAICPLPENGHSVQ